MRDDIWAQVDILLPPVSPSVNSNSITAHECECKYGREGDGGARAEIKTLVDNVTDTDMFIKETWWAAKGDRPGQNNGLGQQHNGFIRRVNVIKEKEIEEGNIKPRRVRKPTEDDGVIPRGNLMLIKIEALTG